MSTTPAQPALRLARDVKNFLQALVALRFKRVYLPSIFAHYTVNSACNLRCSYCYVGQPEIFPQGFANAGLPLERAKRVLATLRQECLFLRFQGGEPTVYKPINELARYAKQDLCFRHISLITNGVLLARHPEQYDLLFQSIDAITISIDQTRLNQYPTEMARLLSSLPELTAVCKRHRVALTCNYTAAWEELEQPERIERALERLGSHFASTYIMPVRQAGKTPLPLLKNALVLNRRYSLSSRKGFVYPETEQVKWYRDHCDPKLKIKVDADGGLVYPCENHSYAAGSLETHTIRELWTKELVHYPNESCMGCGKQRFRSHAMKHVGESWHIMARLLRLPAVGRGPITSTPRRTAVRAAEHA
jgi:sulfatase maturation enzyme AslB (radical SAM superfamily)